MPLTARGREILGSLPGVAPTTTTDGIGCEIVRRDELCIGCGRCVKACPSAAIAESSRFDPVQLYRAPAGTTRGALGAALRRIARHEPNGSFEVPPPRPDLPDDRVRPHTLSRLRGVHARLPDRRREGAARRRARGGRDRAVTRTRLAGAGVTRTPTGVAAATRVLVCECAGTMAANVDFNLLERGLAADGGVVERRRVWCGAEGQARLAELSEDESDERLVFVGCSADSVAQRFGRLLAQDLELEVADVREGCSWVHGDDRAAVTDKALRIARAVARFPVARQPAGGGRCTRRLRRRRRRRRRRHRDGNRARPPRPSRRPRRTPALPRRLRHPHRHRLSDERLWGVPADRRGAVGGPQVPLPQRRRRPPEPRRSGVAPRWSRCPGIRASSRSPCASCRTW